MSETPSREISQAIFDTLLYSDVFDFPLTAPEIHRYLSGSAATYEEVWQALSSDARFSRVGDYFTLNGRDKIVENREKRELRSRKLLPYALTFGRFIGSLPFVRMTALTGSLAVRNISKEADFDYMLVTQPGRLWTARACVLLFNRLTRLTGHTICPNVIVSENAMEWEQHDLYSARDLCQMIPISGMDLYQRLMKANHWVRGFLPNAYDEILDLPNPEKESHLRIVQRALEFLVRGSLGDRFEHWEMNRKIERFSKQEGYSDETIFTADICQGNFDHHRQWTQREFLKRVRSYDVGASLHEGRMM